MGFQEFGFLIIWTLAAHLGGFLPGLRLLTGLWLPETTWASYALGRSDLGFGFLGGLGLPTSGLPALCASYVGVGPCCSPLIFGNFVLPKVCTWIPKVYGKPKASKMAPKAIRLPTFGVQGEVSIHQGRRRMIKLAALQARVPMGP